MKRGTSANNTFSAASPTKPNTTTPATHQTLQAIARGNLDEALAYNWSTKLDTMQVLAKSHRDLAAKLVRELEAVLAGGKRIGRV